MSLIPRSIIILLSLFFSFTSISHGGTAQEPHFSFEVTADTDLFIGTSKILNIVDLGPNMTEDTVKVQGQLLTLFGEPAYTSKDLEMAYDYVIIAKTSDGKEFVLSAYAGPSGPAIGGNGDIDGIMEAAEELREYILSAKPSDYEYDGYYLDIPVRIHQGIKNGQIFYSETAMSDEEFAQAFRELFPDFELSE